MTRKGIIKHLSIMIAGILVLNIFNLQGRAETVNAATPESTQVIVAVSDVNQLVEAINEANKNSDDHVGYTLIIESGEYILNQLLYIQGNHITLKSKTGSYRDVVIKGKGMYGTVGHVFLVVGDYFTLQGISFGEVANHAIQIQGEKGASYMTMENCRLYDAYEQLLKVSKGSDSTIQSVGCIVDKCLFEYTKEIGPQYYIGGVDAHNAKDWIIRNSTFKHIKSPDSELAEHAIHFWSGSTGTLVENNHIIDCDRGIGFGLGSSFHYNGIIRNNYVNTTRDVGIGLENAANVQVYDNAVFTEHYNNSIEYRFKGTTANIHNNMTNKSIVQREDGVAALDGNTKSDLVTDTITDRAVDVVIMDVPSSWASNSVTYLLEEKLVSEDFLIDYQKNITRKDFAYLSVLLYEQLSGQPLPEISQGDYSIFTDTKDENVIKAYKLGIIDGYGQGIFGPEDFITREQIGVILVRTMGLSGIHLARSGNTTLVFKDHNQISTWALDFVRTAYRHGIMNGVSLLTLAPRTFATREQAFVLIYNILSRKEPFETEELSSVEKGSSSIGQPELVFKNGGAFSSWVETGWYSTPAVADLNGDGKNEIIASGYSIVVLDGATGQLLWRVKSGHDRSEGDVDNVGRTWSDIIVEDINGDGELEIITAHSGGVVSVYNKNGYFMKGWPKKPISKELRGLKVSDLDADGTSEILVTGAVGSKTNIWVYEHDGSLRTGWPQLDNELGYGYGVFNNTMAVGDLDNDGKEEIVLPSDTHYICAYYANGKQLQANAMYGNKKWGAVGVWESLETELRGWGELEGSRSERYRPNFALGASVIEDVNNDGQMEVIVTGNVYDAKVGHPPGLYYGLYIFNSDRSRFNASGYNWEAVPIDTGTPLSEDYDVIENIQPNPVVADLDNDGLKEILYASYDGKVHCFSLDKTEHDAWPYSVYKKSDGYYQFPSIPTVIDLNRDGLMEVIFTTWTQKSSGVNGRLLIVNYKGETLYDTPLPDSFGTDQVNGALASPKVYDMDLDGNYEIIINSVHSGVLMYKVPLVI